MSRAIEPESATQQWATHTVGGLARAYAPGLRRFFERRILEHSDVEDLVQEVFLRLTRHGGIGGVGNVEGYLFQVAANVLRDRLRKRASRRAKQHEPIGDEHQLIAAADSSPEHVLQSQEALSRLSQVLSQLPERTRTVFVLCRMEGIPYAEVARGLGISLSSVNKHLAKALEELLKQMKEVL
jgi:RNA polymerase sigma factor (sigma-70 family)